MSYYRRVVNIVERKGDIPSPDFDDLVRKPKPADPTDGDR